MTTFIIKHRDWYGEWFFMRPGMWSDTAGDAFRFRKESTAAHEAEAAQGRPNAKGHAAERQAVCRVIAIRPLMHNREAYLRA